MKGAVAAGHPLTAEAGAQMLREGGNAFDAAVAAALASFATESTLTGLGAGGFMTAHTAAGEDHVFDFFVVAGGRDLDPSGRADLVAIEVAFDETTKQVFNIGPSSCGVPGNPAGLWEIAERFGSVPFNELIRPAVRLSREGVPVSGINEYLFAILEPVLTEYSETRRWYAPDGHVLREGERFRFPELGDALERLAADGPASVYDSEVTQRICDWVCERGGLLSRADFRDYRVVERDPVRAGYRGREVLTNSPPSTGGILIAYALEMLERLGPPLPLDDAAGLAALTEVMRECNDARDPEFGQGLERAGFAREFLSAGRIDDAVAHVEARLAGQVEAEQRRRGDALGSTTHISAADELGNAVAITCSNGTGSGVTVPGTGIQLNNMLGEEDLNPLGFHMHSPGERVTSMMAPTIVLNGGDVEMALGSAGSNRLRSAILQVIRNVVDYSLPVDEAVRRPRIHYEAGVLQAEPGYDHGALGVLAQRGYELFEWDRLNLFFGGAQAVHRDLTSGVLSGGGDPRRGGAVVTVD